MNRFAPRSIRPPAPASPWRRNVALGLAAGLLFAALASVRLTAQGPQYDELHQAVGAFTWVGAPPPAAFCLDFHGVCVLNTTYSAALKTNLYGLYLRLTGRGFRLTDWRLIGILLVALSLPLFAWGTRSALHPSELALFFVLILTDGSLLLLARFDWGPVVLAFLLRLAMLALWLRGEAAERLALANSLALGALVSFAAFEKLSSALLVLPLCAILLGSARRRNLQHFGAAALGLGLGALPLGLINLGWLVRTGELISLRNLRGSPNLGAFDLARELLALGRGERVRQFVLGLPASPVAAWIEAGLLLAALGLAAYAVLRRPRTEQGGLAAVALISFLLLGMGLRLLPRATWAHHWILATPWQYIALALAIRPLWTPGDSPVGRGPRIAFATLCGVWLAVRLLSLATLEGALVRGRSGVAWDPSLAAIGRFAARSPRAALFVASDWGVGTQILCFDNGRSDRLLEPFWEPGGLDTPEAARALRGASILYLVHLRGARGTSASTAIEQQVFAEPGWNEVPPEPATRSWPAVSLRKLIRTLPSPGMKERPE